MCGGTLSSVTWKGSFPSFSRFYIWERWKLKREKEKIAIRCKECNNRMFDYVSGDMHIEMKCVRCKRVLVLKNYSEDMIRAGAVNGECRI